MYESLWTSLREKKNFDRTIYYRIWYRRAGEGYKYYLASGIDDVARWIVNESKGCEWTVERSVMVLSDEEV